MTSKEYVVWLQGFVEACNEYTPTPKQWDALKDKLAEVKDEEIPPFKPYPTPIQTLPFSQPVDPYNPYKIYSGTSTSTAYSSGSAWSYTDTISSNKWAEHQAKMADYKPYNPPYTTGGEDEMVKHHNED